MAIIEEKYTVIADGTGRGFITGKIDDVTGEITLQIESSLRRDWYVSLETSAGTKSLVVKPNTSHLIAGRPWLKTLLQLRERTFDVTSVESMYPAGSGRKTDIS